jgi:MSHA type pilus biogenesis protein MshL
VPDFVSASEEISPLKTRVIDIAARNRPLRDILHIIAESTGLNLVFESGVNSETTLNLNLKNVTVEDALNIIFSSVDYFYSIENNMLIVKAVETKIFELGHPAIVQTYSVDVGGDILGATTSGGGTTGTTSTTISGIKGSVTQSGKSDTAAFNFWDAVEKSITTLLMTGQQAQPTTPLPAGTVATVPPKESFTINRLTGTIFVTASKKSLKKVEQYIETIKKVINRQVIVEAKIIEVSLSDTLKYGINWTFLETSAGFGKITAGTTAYSSVVTSGSPTFSIGTTGSNFTSLLNALQEQGEVRTLSNPRINIMNGQTALLSVGRSTSYISRVETTTTTTGTAPTITYTVERGSVLSGIIIGIVPYINENGEISLTITPIISDLVKLEDKTLGQSGSNQIQLSFPTVDLKELSTTVKVRDGQMIVIGGLISKKESVTDDKVPVLGDIPVVGELFKRKDKLETKTELVIVLQPTLVSK